MGPRPVPSASYDTTCTSHRSVRSRRRTRRNSTIPEMRVVGAAYFTTTTSRFCSPTGSDLHHEVAAEPPEAAVARPPLEPGHHAGQARERVGVLRGGEDADAAHRLDRPPGRQHAADLPQAVVADVDGLAPAEGAGHAVGQPLE